VGVITKRAQSLQANRASGGLYPLVDGNFDAALGATNYCIAWEEIGYSGQMAVRYSIRSIASDAEIQFGIFSGAGAALDVYVKPRVIYDSVNDLFAVFTSHFLAGNTNFDVEGTLIPELGGALVGPAVIIAVPVGAAAVESVARAEALFDAAICVTDPTRVFYCVCARQANVAGNVFMRLMDKDLAAIVATTNGAPAAKPVSLTAHATTAGAGLLIGHALYGATTNLRGYRLPSNTGVQSAEVTITTVAATLVGRVAVVDNVAGTSLYVTFDDFLTVGDRSATTYLVSCSVAHVLTSQTAISTNCFITGRIFSMRSRLYQPVSFTSRQYQSVTLVLDLTCAIRNLAGTAAAQPLFVARLDWGETATPFYFAQGSEQRVPASFEALLPYLKYETNTRLAGTDNVTAYAISFAKFAPQEHLADAKWNGDTYLAGALPMLTDGVSMVEEGFHWNPEVIGTVTNGLVVVPPLANGTGFVDIPAPAAYPATYVLAFTEAWQDAQGNWHESGTAFLCSLTIAVAGNRAINPIIVRPPSLKRDQSQLVAGVRRGLMMYRTLPSSTDTTLYLAHKGDLISNGSVVSDANLASGEPLYTEGGVLGNTPAPSCRHIAVANERMVLSGCGDGSKVYWSKKVAQGFAAEFVSDDVKHQKIIPPGAGRVVGVAEMLGNHVIVGEQQIGLIYGDGPDPTGVQGEFSSFKTVAENIGARWTAPKSIRLAAEGVWFQSPFGLRLFSGQGIAHNQGRPVGSEVDDIVVDNVITLGGGTAQQTRFRQRDTFLVWDQVWGQFTRFTNHASLDACLVGGDYYLLDNQGGLSALLRRRDPNWIASDSTINGGIPSLVPVIGNIVLGDIQFGGVQGFQRVKRMLLLAKINDTDATPSFAIHVGYNGADPAALAEVTALPTHAQPVIQFEHQFFTQKCESLRLQIKFYDPLGWSTVRLTDLVLSVGVKKGPWKSAEVK
jgi:hypothetical protein